MVSSKQIVRKQSKVQRRVEYYGFPAPLNVLMDTIVLGAVHSKEIAKSLISSYLGHDVNLFTTRCTLAKSNLSENLPVDISVISCCHGEKEAENCIPNLIGSANPGSYYVATGCIKLFSELQPIASVPLLRFRHGDVHLHRPSDLPKKAKDAVYQVKRKRSASASVDDPSPEAPLKKRTSEVEDAGPVSNVLPDDKEEITANRKHHWLINPICKDDSSDDDNQDSENTVVFVVGFTVIGNFDMVRHRLREVFRSCGGIERIYITQDKVTGLPKNSAFITFTDRNSVYKALRLNGTDVGGTAITVEEQGVRLYE